MSKKLLSTLLILLISTICYSQIVIPKYVKLSADSARLINSLNGFLGASAKANKDNAFVLKNGLVETSALLDEMKGIGNAGADKKDFYKCYLTNVTELDSVSFMVQLGFMAVYEGVPVLRADFKLVARRQGDGYGFGSPLRLNTEGWPGKKMGNFTVYYNNAVFMPEAVQYAKKAMEYDKRLHAFDYPSEVYCVEGFVQALALLGVEYKMDYTGIAHANLATWESGRSLYIIGASGNDLTAFDPHDLWHSRLHHVVSTDVINRPVDEACAYLYGGSWGVYTWTDILREFKTFTRADHDWLKIFTSHAKFGSAKTPLYADYVIDAFIVRQLEKDKGIKAVIELLSCGKKQPDNENFFKALEKVAGITKANFNVKVEALMAER